MTGLLIKDWKLFKNQGRYFLIMLIIALAMLFAGTKEYSSFICSYFTWMAAYFTLSTISYDEYDNGMSFLMALPISRRIYIKEKYTLCILLTGCAWLIFTGIDILFFNISSTPGEMLEMLATQPVVLLIAFVFISVSLPLFLKYGPEKGRIMAAGIVFVFALAVICLGKRGIGVYELKELDILLIQKPFMAIGVCAVICLVIVGISYKIAVKLMERREF